MFNLQQYLNAKTRLINEALERSLPAETTRPAALHKAMRYSVLAGGKRLRPIMCLAAAEAAGGSEKPALPAALAIEILHTYTLIHDDLPCMDNDDLRRGKPTCHVAFGEANAILAGDALLTLAFEWLAAGVAGMESKVGRDHALSVVNSRACHAKGVVPPRPDWQSGPTLGSGSKDGRARARPLHLILELTRAAGSLGVIGGQAEDLAAEGKTPDKKTVEFIHLHKTAVLIRAAVRMGGICAEASPAVLKALSAYGTKAGLAFQVADDILNATSTPEALGKATGSDKKRGKMTYVAVHGLAGAKKAVARLAEEAVKSLAPLKGNIEPLRAIVEYIGARKK